ncbi:MAG: hypothetical protein ABSF28_20645 [Terracidiphilus sp.]|jgi:hypothetical protein
MRNTFSKFILAPAIMAAATLATIPAVAETATVTVPFNFSVAGQTFPAGVYSVQHDSVGDIVTLQSQQTSQSFAWIASPTSGAKSTSVSLKFDQQGNSYTLHSVQAGALVTPTLDKKTAASERMSINAGQ